MLRHLSIFASAGFNPFPVKYEERKGMLGITRSGKIDNGGVRVTYMCSRVS